MKGMSQQKLKAMNVLSQEFKHLERNPLLNFGITVGLINEDDFFHWKGTIMGPKGTPYHNGLFHLKIDFPDDYPNSRPEIIFLTPIYHLNIQCTQNPYQPLGHTCLNTINLWQPNDSIIKVLPELFTLLMKNNPESAYDDEVNTRINEFINNRELFNKKAKYFTKKYASPFAKLKEYKNGWDFTYKQ